MKFHTADFYIGVRLGNGVLTESKIAMFIQTDWKADKQIILFAKISSTKHSYCVSL